MLALTALPLLSRAQDNTTGTTVVETFTGNGTTTTSSFKVRDKWEVRWHSPVILSITVYSADHNIVAGTMGMSSGSFYLPTGGNYYLQIEGAKNPPGFYRNPTQNRNVPNTGLMQTLNGGDNNNGSNDSNGNNGTSGNPPQPPQMPPDFLKWNVQVVELGSGDTNSGEPMATNFVPPSTLAAAPTPTPAPLAATNEPAGKLTADQARAVVLIKGDNAEGTGFLVKMTTGPVVITNLHVLANNPNIKITTNSGTQVSVVSVKGAADRDLAMLTIQDAGYSYLDTTADVSKVAQTGDEVITPGNSEGGEVVLNTPGTVLGIGPQRVEFSNPIYHGNSGGPVFHTKSGKVLGVVTEAIKVDISDDLDKTSFASRNSAIKGSLRYFGLRFDTVPDWIDVDWRRFQNETLFLDQFQDQNRRLDSYLNAADDKSRRNDNDNGNGDQSSNSEDANLYRSDENIMKATDRYQQSSSGADIAQRLEALRGLLFDLQSVADSNVDQIQNMNNFYSFDQEQAKEELAYRKALKAELDSIGNNVDRLGSLPRTNN